MQTPDEAELLGRLRSRLDEGGVVAATAACREHVRADPADPAAYRHLAQLLAADGQTLPAQRAAMRACELAPHDPRSWNDLGRVHARAGELALAAQCFQEALEIRLDDAAAWHNLGLALHRLDRHEEAFVALKRSLAIDAAHAQGWVSLGDLLTDLGQVDDAVECFERAAACDPTQAAARLHLAQRLLEGGSVPRAQQLFRQALVLDPAQPAAWLGLARSCEDLGDAAGARDAYAQVLQLDGELLPIALGGYLALRPAGGPQDDFERVVVARAERALGDAGTDDDDRAHIGYGLAKHHDRRGHLEAAAAAASQANAARVHRHGRLDRAALAARVDGLIASCSRSLFASTRGGGLDTPQPVFIVGMPRSGTTLVEQILAAHGQIHGAGELPTLPYLAAGTVDDLADVWRAAAAIDVPGSRALAARYLRRLRNGVPRGRRRITDKSPLNFFHLGFAARLFPGARVIHCVRDRRDTALSIWLENFNAEQRYATDFEDLAFFMTQYQRLMAHWHEVLPLPIHEVRYETLVANIDTETRRLTSFLDVPWDPACLDFHRLDRAVQTPSRWQVRQPIHAGSIGRWRRYVPHLPELDTAFGSSGWR